MIRRLIAWVQGYDWIGNPGCAGNPNRWALDSCMRRRSNWLIWRPL